VRRSQNVRVFVAIDVGDPFQRAARAGIDGAPSHLTLRFLGDLPDDRVEAVREALRSTVARSPPFDFVLEGIGAFPSRHDPRVVWIGVTTGAERVIRLAHDVSEELVARGFPAEPHDVVPHVTWFRVRSVPSRRRARALLEGAAPVPPPHPVRVTEVVLKESTWTAEGPRHRTVERFALAGAPPPSR
jgi:RNA 2',3'-cyclic 3'-phosphodiesterase